MTTPAPFHETWTAADTNIQLDGIENKTLDTKESDKKLRQSIGRHVAWLIEQGHQVIPPFCDNVSLPLILDLRKLAEAPRDDDLQEQVGRHFEFRMEIRMNFYGGKRKTSEQMHQNVVEGVEDGDFTFPPGDIGNCRLSGRPLYLIFKGWNSTANTAVVEDVPNSFRSIYHFSPLVEDQVPEQTSYVVEIPMPTGELLIADWFRIPAFHEMCKVIDDDNKHDIGAIGGRADVTKRYASLFGVAHVACLSPDILQDEGVIQGGYVDMDSDIPRNQIGKISADLRWTTMVDRGHMVDLITPALGKKEAEKQVSEYLEANKRDIVKATVNPGTHHLYFAGNYVFFNNTINKAFEAEGLYLEQFEEAAFALTEKPLKPRIQEATSPKKKRAPKAMK